LHDLSVFALKQGEKLLVGHEKYFQAGCSPPLYAQRETEEARKLFDSKQVEPIRGAYFGRVKVNIEMVEPAMKLASQPPSRDNELLSGK